jgi:hypothetical protein
VLADGTVGEIQVIRPLDRNQYGLDNETYFTFDPPNFSPKKSPGVQRGRSLFCATS